MARTEDSMSDDVFVQPDEDISKRTNQRLSPYRGGSGNNQNPNQTQPPASTGYRGDFKAPIQLLNQQDNCGILHKTILLGDSGVGKTTLLVRFNTGEFQTSNFSATVGIGFTNKVVNVDGSKVKLQIWDTAGQERFRSVTHAYYRDAHALLLLYDVTNRSSFDNTRAWLSEIKEYAQDDVVIMLLGNKADCKYAERVIRKEDGEKLAKEYSVAFMETSAKSGQNVDLAFMAIAKQLLSKHSEEFSKSSFNVNDYIKEQTQSTSCACSI